MTQQFALFDPSLEYYCHSCRKPLKHSVRVIAKTTDFNCYLDFCPPCLTHQNYINKVQSYYISKKIGPIFKEININSSQLLDSISTVQKEGIQQMFLRCLKIQDKDFKIYEQLNKKVFAQVKPQLKIDFGAYKIPVFGEQREKPNPPNRKHLKTLGYNWQREELNVQPELIFGYLMGCLQEEEQAAQDQIELRNIIYNYYNQEQKIVEQIQHFLVQSPFLLARKAIYDLQQVPKQLTQLKNIESEIKELVFTICNMNLDDQTPKISKSSPNKYEKSVKKKSKKSNDKDRRQRTRQKNDNKNDNKNNNKNDNKNDNKKDNKNDNKKDNKKEKKHQKVQKSNSQQSVQLNQISIKQPKSESEASESTQRKRGRPKGSKSSIKLQRRRGKSRHIELKMDIQHKISYKRQKTDSRDCEEDESYQNRKRRKLNEQTEQQSQSDQDIHPRESNSQQQK